MTRTNLLGALLLALGIAALAFGGFTYTKKTDKAEIGPIQLEVRDLETVRIPIWLSVSTSALGGVLLARRSRGHSA